MNFNTDFKCPKHEGEKLRRLFYNKCISVDGKKRGTHIYTKILFCPICKKTYPVKTKRVMVETI